jgi:glycine C-acetyltransferase
VEAFVMSSAGAALNARINATLDEIKGNGLWKEERLLLGAQGARIRVAQGEVSNFCANNYLGLANHPALVAAAKTGLDERGLGLASVRFICGTQDKHKVLERRLAGFLGYEDCILFTSCWDANGGIFETLLGEEDAVISDSLNHASIIDGIRLCKAERVRWTHGDLGELRRHLVATKDKRTRLIATDGVFSMDGDVADLRAICDLADEHDALVFVDDSHATGFFGPTGRGSIEHCGVMGRVDLLNSTLGKALGGASGGFTCASRAVVDLLRQRARPYLFSNTLAPSLVAATIACLDLLEGGNELRERLVQNTRRFRERMSAAGFTLRPGVHPICPIMLGDAVLAQRMAHALLGEGIYVIGFSFPVVPKGQARIRVQLSAAHTLEEVDRCVDAFTRVGKDLGVIA